jgi:cytochrome b6-f complex iron-sulfur subunit
MADYSISRRDALTVGAAAAGGVVLAGCSSGSSKSGTSAPANPAPSKGSESAGSGSSGKPLTPLSDVPVGGAVSATGADGKPIIVSQPTAGTVVAFSAICTHMGCTVAPAGKQLHCPCHGSRYDASTGQVLRGPAPRPLPKVDVHLVSGEVVSGA